MAESELLPLTASGFNFSKIIQEDYGWGFWARGGSDPLWLACSCVGEGPQEARAERVVSVAYDPGLNLFKRVFHRLDAERFTQLRNRIWQILKSNHAIRIVPPET